MINKIKLKDFQSHRDSTIELDKGVNVIAGSSGVGKSSIIRALSYLFTNKKPNGVEYKRRPDANSFEIEVDVDGHKIKRVKGSKVNEYHIDGQTYKDIGTSVPDKLYSTTNIAPIRVGSDEFNVQLSKQFDPHFLMFLPDSSKVKFLNRLSGSHILDIALKDTGKDLNNAEKNKLHNENELDIVQSTINNLMDMCNPIKAVLNDAKERYEELQDSDKRITELRSAKSHMDSYLKQKNEFDAIHKIIDNVNIEGFEFKVNRLNDLYNLKNLFDTNKNTKKCILSVIDKIDKLNVEYLESKKNKLDNLKILCNNYLSIKRDLDSVSNELNSVGCKIQSSIDEVKLFLENTPKCPTCNTNITKSKIDKIIKELEQ